MDKDNKYMNTEEEKWIDKFESTIAKSRDEYINIAELIKSQVDSDGVYNIGIVAPYGAGKSCAIETFKKKKVPIKEQKRICTISVANYDSIINRISDEGSKQFSNKELEDESSIEKSVLQQILYKNTSYKVVDSRFKSVASFKRINVIGSLTILFLIISILFLVFQFFNVDNNYLYVKNDFWRQFLCWFSLIVSILAVFIISYYSIKHKFFKRLKISGVEIEKDSEKEPSVFNKNIDEIIYRFQRLKYNLVIIEDLDRFNNHNIFAKLRELCTIINSNNLVKKGVEKSLLSMLLEIQCLKTQRKEANSLM